MRGWAHSGPSEQVRKGQKPGSHPPPPVSETLSCPASRGDMCKQSGRLGVGVGLHRERMEGLLWPTAPPLAGRGLSALTLDLPRAGRGWALGQGLKPEKVSLGP